MTGAGRAWRALDGVSRQYYRLLPGRLRRWFGRPFDQPIEGDRLHRLGLPITFLLALAVVATAVRSRPEGLVAVPAFPLIQLQLESAIFGIVGGVVRGAVRGWREGAVSR